MSLQISLNCVSDSPYKPGEGPSRPLGWTFISSSTWDTSAIHAGARVLAAAGGQGAGLAGAGPRRRAHRADTGGGEDVLEEGVGVEVEVGVGELREQGRVVRLVVVAVVAAVQATAAVAAVAAEPKPIVIVWHGVGSRGLWKVVVVHVGVVAVARVGVAGVAGVVLVVEASLWLGAVWVLAVTVLLLLLLDGALLDVVGELSRRHAVGFLAVGLELGAPELGLSKCGGRVDHGRVPGLEVVGRGGAGRGAGGGVAGSGGVAALAGPGRGQGRGQRPRQRRHGAPAPAAGARQWAGAGHHGAAVPCRGPGAVGLWKTEAIEGGGEGVQRQEPGPGVGVAHVLQGHAAVLLLAVEDLDGALLAHPVAHLPGVDPDGEVSGEVLDDVGDGVAALPGGAVEHGVGRVGDLEASVGGPLEGLVWVPVALELVPQRGLQLLAEQVDPPDQTKLN